MLEINRLYSTHIDCTHFLNTRASYKLAFTKSTANDWTTNWHVPSTSTRIKSWAAAAADFQHPLKRAQAENRYDPLCVLGKTGRTGLQIVRYLQRILWAQFLHLLIIRKMLTSLWWHLLPMTSSKPLTKCELDCTELFPEIIYDTDLPPCLLVAISQHNLKCCLLGFSPHFAPK